MSARVNQLCTYFLNLKNGTGVYEELSALVVRQREYLIGSTEKGMQLVRDNKNYAVIGGRETFYYDIKRFGKKHTDDSHDILCLLLNQNVHTYPYILVHHGKIIRQTSRSRNSRLQRKPYNFK